jgi:hypothetical protein
MIKQCVRCKHFKRVAVRVSPLEPVPIEKTWKCKRGHQIKNPHEITECKDFEEKKIVGDEEG